MKTIITILILLPFISHAQWKATGVYDTIKTKLIVQQCDNCTTDRVNGYKVLEKYTYIGDKKPNVDYPDYWQELFFLNPAKSKYVNCKILWDTKEKW